MSEESFNELEQIFPSWDKQRLRSLFDANGQSLEATIDAVFAAEAAAENINSTNVTENTSVSREQPHPNAPTSGESGMSGQREYRGLFCPLPLDFLRPPGWSTSGQMQDEQLAMMLQNELFLEQQRQRQMIQQQMQQQQLYGYPPQRGQIVYHTRGRVPRTAGGPDVIIASNPRVIQVPESRPAYSNQRSSRTNNGQPVPGQDDILPDMGIMKTFNAMGSKISSMAKRSSTTPASSSGEANDDNTNRNSQFSGSNPSSRNQTPTPGSRPAPSNTNTPSNSNSNRGVSNTAHHDEDDEEFTEINPLVGSREAEMTSLVGNTSRRASATTTASTSHSDNWM